MKKVFFLFLLFAVTHDLYAINPDRNYKNTPASLGIDHEQYIINTSDGYNLKTWKLLPKNEDRYTTIIFAYGDSGNMSYFLKQAQILSSKGYTMLLFDYRGFGQSSDFDMNHDYLYYNEFGHDLASVIKWAKEHIQNNMTGVWALSMGTVATTIALQEEDIDFFVAEGFVKDPLLIKERLDNEDINIILPEGADQYHGMVSKIDTKTLIFAGNKDTVTTVRDAESIVDPNENRELVIFEGNHLQGMRVLSGSSFGEEYFNKMIFFIHM